MFKVTNQETQYSHETEASETPTAPRKRYHVAKAETPADRDVVRALECFLNTEETRARFGHYFVDGHELYYRAVCTNRGLQTLREDLIAMKLERAGETVILGNSSALPLIGRSVSFGNEQLNTRETEVQRRLALCVPMLPFSVFTQAKLDLSKIELIERGPEETVTRKRNTGKRDKAGKAIIVDETVHFTGASLFSVEGVSFLFDIDRREIEHKVFNPFLVKLPEACESIAAAYQMLKPAAVVEAERRGLKVRRQGEFFFIPATAADAKRLDKLSKEYLIPLELRAGNNRPNTAKGIQLVDGSPIKAGDSWETRAAARELVAKGKTSQCFVTGKVSHTGREHADLILTGWYVAYPNTATESFTITGDID